MLQMAPAVIPGKQGPPPAKSPSGPTMLRLTQMPRGAACYLSTCSPQGHASSTGCSGGPRGWRRREAGRWAVGEAQVGLWRGFGWAATCLGRP